MTASSGGPLQLVALILLGLSGANSLGILPVLVSAFADQGGFSLATAGVLVSIQLTAMLTGNAALLGPLRGLPVRRIAAGGLGLIIIGNALSAGADGFAAHAACRVIAGLGEGCTIAFAGQLAQRATADRDFAIYTAVILIAGAVNLELAPTLLERFGVAGLLGLIAAYATVGLLLLGALPDRLHAPRTADAAARPATRVDALVLVLILYVGLASLWTLVGRFGIASGLEASEVSQIIGRAFLIAGLAGAALAPTLARRFGNQRVVAAMVCGMATAGVVLALQPGGNAFMFATAGFIFAWFTCFPNVMGFLAKLDPLGGLAVSGMLAQTLGFAISPAFSASLTGAIGLAGAGWVAIAFLGASLVMLVIVNRRSTP
jgi:predicted MFS family arabinose efflux permease